MSEKPTYEELEQRVNELEKEKDRLLSELQQALREVKQLGGLLPICAKCKKIRDDIRILE
ncbi:MAG: hypothetical protein H8D87_13550 [Deltaproteobacteria bacterium]|uniref:hypothetical protein n=1 Tax=Desulfobacula sp. TaxID=2593537 RepID=UPI0019902703|nr:hypothetical protein [Candidatus Desulfobacula maris]MBL6995221.1 hypothetical protein [Desulfobacula sp.]